MRVRYLCHYSSLTGIGRAARDYCAALDAVEGIELEIAVLGSEVHGLASPEERYAALGLDQLAVPLSAVVGTPDVAIYHTTPRVLNAIVAGSVPDLAWPAPRSVKTVALTTWETDRFPEENAQTLGRFDAVIVPSQFCESVILAELVPHLPSSALHVVPHCFDEDFWPHAAGPSQPGILEPFRFYTIGAWGERKNLLGIIRAYLAAFTRADNVMLMMVIDKPDFDAVRSLAARSGMRSEDLPEIYIPDSSGLDEDELVGLHTGGDCFVSASRGEGWGLGLFEAAIVGKRIIAPAWSGERDFLQLYPGWSEIGYQRTPCFGGVGHTTVVVENGQSVARQTLGLPAGVTCKQHWADPDLSELALAMRQVYSTPDSRSSEDFRTSRAIFEGRFGYRVVGPQLANILRGIAWQTHSDT